MRRPTKHECAESSAMRLLLRIFAECLPQDDAAALGRQLLERLAAFDASPTGQPERYWKIPEWTEYTFRLGQDSAAGFEAFLASHPEGWSHSGDDTERSSVWNPPSGPTAGNSHAAKLLHTKVRWAELILTFDASD